MRGRRLGADVGGCDAALVARLLPALDAAFPTLRRSVRKTLAVVCTGLLAVMAAARSGAGALSLAALYRVLPSPGCPHSRENRLRRFLDNPRLEGRAVSTGVARVLFRPGAPRRVPFLLDQTKAGTTQALVVAVPFQGRALPLAVWTFTYPWREAMPSQNTLEAWCLSTVETSLPRGVIPVWVGDRGFARARLLGDCRRTERLFLLRGRGNTRVTVAGRTLKLGAVPAPTDAPVCYPHVLYHATQQIPVDVIAFHDPAFRDPWYLLVPADSAALWTPAEIVTLYRERMQIEQSFRDFKTHLGLRGLRLQVRIAERMGRLLWAFCLAYALLVLLGDTAVGQAARRDLEIPRRRPRHGTTRTQSALSIGRLLLYHPRHAARGFHALGVLLTRVARGAALFPISVCLLPVATGPPGK
jgi:Transposase DDE domain